MESESRTVTLADLVRVVVRRWRTVVLAGLVGAAAGLGYLTLVPPTYTATTEVALRLPVTEVFAYPGTGADRVINMNVEASLAGGAEVMAAVADATGQPVGGVRDALTVEAPVGGQQLRFQYVAASGAEAARGADIAAGAYLALREEMYARQRADRVAAYDQNLAEIGEQAAAVRAEVDDLPPDSAQDPAAAAVLSELGELHGELAELRDARSEIQSVDLTPGWVTRPARGSPPSTHDRGWLLIAAGAAGGGLLGAVGALAAEAVSRRVRTATDVVETVGLPLIGVIRRRRPGVPPGVVDADTGYAALALAGRLREPVAPEERLPRRLVLIAPRLEPAGNSVLVQLVAGLAVELAAAGRHVYVAGSAGQASELRVAVLSGTRQLASPTPDEAEADVGRLALLDTRAVIDGSFRAGLECESARTLAVGTGTVQIGSDPATAGPEVVLIDAPAAEVSAAGVLAAREALAVVVAACDRTRLVELRRLVDRLHGVGAECVGVLVTRC